MTTMRHLRDINGGRMIDSPMAQPVVPGSRRHQHPSEQPPDPLDTRTLRLNSLEASLVLTALAKSDSPSLPAIGADLALQWAAHSKPAPKRGGA